MQVFASEIDRMIAENIIEIDTTDWTGLFVFGSRHDGSHRSSVDKKKLSEIIVRDSYLFFGNNECSESLEEETVLSKIDVKSEQSKQTLTNKTNIRQPSPPNNGLYSLQRILFELKRPQNLSKCGKSRYYSVSPWLLSGCTKSIVDHF